MKKIKKIFINGIIKNNPIFVMVLGLCPSLAVTNSMNNAIGMGISVIFILFFSNLIISIFKKIIPNEIRIPVFIGIIATFVTTIEMLIHAYFPILYNDLGIFLPLIVVNCIILERAESFASKNKITSSLLDAIATGIGFTLALSIIAFFRELLGAGTLFGIKILNLLVYNPILIMILPPGAFITLAIILAFFSYIKNKKENIKK